MSRHCCDYPDMCTFSDGCCEEGCICREEDEDDLEGLDAVDHGDW